MAIGSMEPGIEIWDLDIIDAVCRSPGKGGASMVCGVLQLRKEWGNTH